MVQIEISSPHSYSTSVHTLCLSCTVWPQYTTRQTDDRWQTDRAIGIYIGDKKTHKLWDKGSPRVRKFLPANFNTNPLNNLVHLQLLWFHEAYLFKVLLHLLPLCRSLNGGVLGTPNLSVCGVRGELRSREWCLSKAHQRLPNTSQCKGLLYLQNMTPQFNPPIWGLGWT